MSRLIMLIFGISFVFKASAQVDSVASFGKNSDVKNGNYYNNNTLKKDTNTFTIINVIQSPSNNAKKNKAPATTDNKSNEDVKTTIIKAKQNSQHWLDAMYVNLICAGINKFVKKD